MVDIYYLGHSCFRIKGKKTTVVIDPFNPTAIGLKLPKDLMADIVLSTHNHDGHNNVSAVSGDPIVITGPGEYEVKGVTIFGMGTFHDEEKGKSRGRNTIYKFTVDGITFLHLGDLGEKINAVMKDDALYSHLQRGAIEAGIKLLDASLTFQQALELAFNFKHT